MRSIYHSRKYCPFALPHIVLELIILSFEKPLQVERRYVDDKRIFLFLISFVPKDFNIKLLLAKATNNLSILRIASIEKLYPLTKDYCQKRYIHFNI